MAEDIEHLSVTISAAFSGMSEAAEKVTRAFEELGTAMAGLNFGLGPISPEAVDRAQAALEAHEDDCFGLAVPAPVDHTRRIDLEDE